VHSALTAVAAISLAVWLYLALARGAFWRLSAFDDDRAAHPAPAAWPRVVAVVPARDEAATITQTVSSLLGQNYPGDFSIVVVDDHSDDGTANLAREAAQRAKAEWRVLVHSAGPLPAGWTGKLWALNEGVSRAASNARAYYWFTDADIVHAPDTLHRLVARAERDQLDVASLMVLLRAKTLPERALIPAFLFFFLKLYPPRRIADPRSRTAGAAGGCILLRRDALERIGGFASIRGEVIDDCALARAVKRSGGRIGMGLTRASVSLRAYNNFREIRDMIARTAFTQLRYSAPLLAGTLLGMLVTYVAPVALVFSPVPAPRILAACVWALMSVLFLPTVRFYRLSPLWAPVLPFTALFYSCATFISALRYWLGHGGQWKGRTQARDV
jgi:hopene-associated glycosyltransferase HpnB